ncbi:ROK family protein [Spiroplasma culicicola]|uniref:Putative ROK family sugar kinase n=1 Tax=Spiroplasma culicicola AES-1 TaxID=1276246 RepID=W6A6G0_9MOLU|nr:ROK family protein [Spiroplasma culicicola]AHI52587.1 putative ROK family sugar kinase [Spiroplasma culicicola AES-1]
MKIAIDIGGMSTKLCIVNNLEIVKKEIIAYDQLISAPELYQLIEKQIEKFINQFDISLIGLAIPGIINPQTGEVGGISAIKDRQKVNFKVMLKQKFNLPVYVENDANCAGIAEMVSGAGKGSQNALFMIVGTGIGGTTFINNKIYHGNNFMAGELGCMLNLINQEGLYQNMSEVSGMYSLTNNFFLKHNQKLTGREIYDNYDKDINCKEAVNIQIHNLAKIIINSSFVIDPDVVIIGGAVSSNPLFMKLLQDEVTRLYKLSNMVLNFTVKACHFNNDANIIGASVLNEMN